MRRILFVDDERHVLDGLRALLRPQRTRWDMVFVDSGALALEELERAPCDVIVTDMKMPVMNGAMLLRKVKEFYPDVVRIVLSGFVEFEMALRTAPVAHHFLIKPCDARVLVNVIERACSLETLVRLPQVRELAGPVEGLPPLPQAYLDLVDVLSNEASAVKDATQVIERDTTVVARVLKLANSVLLGLGREVTSIEQATMYLGTNMLKNMVLATEVFGDETSDIQGTGTIRLQHHSLLVGTIARQLAASDKRMAEDAFIAGVLHDIGKRILEKNRPEQSAAIADRARSEARPLFEVEHDASGVTHAEVGGFLLATWGLPYPVIEATANHHAPWRVESLPGMDARTAVYAANVLAHELTKRTRGEAFAEIDPDYLLTMGLEDPLPEWREMANSCLRESRFSDWLVEPDAHAA